ncbi:ECF transporter S component [Streptomyces sp. NPDC005438]|uniref:ECF transporter S component n=1 Tax=Streptomyces sp. NPDC005438 TaxID=3156880 RepID=UPI0033A7B6E1
MVSSALGVGCGIAVTPLVYANIALNAAGPIAALAIVGAYCFAPALGLAVLRRPGTGILTGLVAGLVQVPVTPFGWQMILTALIWALPLELVFLVTRYRLWGTSFFVVAGAIACALAAVTSVPAYQLGDFAVPVVVLALAVQPLSGAVATLLAKLLSDRLARAGVGPNLRPVEHRG